MNIHVVCQCADDVNKHGDVQVKRLGTAKLRNENETKNEETKRNEICQAKHKRSKNNQ
jgi:hypothetical protein